MSSEEFKKLPSIEKLLQGPRLTKWKEALSHTIRVQLAQTLITQIREQIKQGKPCPSFDDVQSELGKSYDDFSRLRIQPVINATGVLLHTNLGRAPLGKQILNRMAETLSSYCTLEYDPKKGQRGSRSAAIEKLVSLVCEVPAALVVNNNAASIVLILNELARGKKVIISRGELVQIGGGFRIPDIMKATGTDLLEVGTTNITQLKDYSSALEEHGKDISMILKVHQSNFYIEGHSEEVPMSELKDLAKKHGVEFVVDLGSGCVVDQKLDFHEKTVNEVVRSGADLICFSGDKLLGGPQAGIIIGNKKLVDQLKEAPYYRALRLGKTELFLLEETLHYYAGNKLPPVWQLLNQKDSEVKSRSEKLQANLAKKNKKTEILPGKSTIGGGAMPSTTVPTYLLELKLDDVEKFIKRLRTSDPCVVIRTENKHLYVDLRSVFPEQESSLENALLEAWE